MALQINDSFQVNSAVPIDVRIMLTKNEMLNIDENLMPDVYFAICTDGKFYLYNKANSVDPTTGKFRVLEGSGGAKIDNWVAGNSYNTDDLVVYSSAIYQCTTTNNDAVFDKAKWKVLGGETVFTEIDKTTIDLATDLATGNYILTGEIEGIAFDKEVVSVLVDGDVYTIATLSGKVFTFDVVKNTKVEDKFATETKVDEKIHDSLYVEEHYKFNADGIGAFTIVADGTATLPTEVELSVVQAKVLANDTHTSYVVGETVDLIPTKEKYLKETDFVLEEELLDLDTFDLP